MIVTPCLSSFRRPVSYLVRCVRYVTWTLHSKRNGTLKVFFCKKYKTTNLVLLVFILKTANLSAILT